MKFQADQGRIFEGTLPAKKASGKGYGFATATEQPAKERSAGVKCVRKRSALSEISGNVQPAKKSKASDTSPSVVVAKVLDVHKAVPKFRSIVALLSYQINFERIGEELDIRKWNDRPPRRQGSGTSKVGDMTLGVEDLCDSKAVDVKGAQ